MHCFSCFTLNLVGYSTALASVGWPKTQRMAILFCCLCLIDQCLKLGEVVIMGHHCTRGCLHEEYDRTLSGSIHTAPFIWRCSWVEQVHDFHALFHHDKWYFCVILKFHDHSLLSHPKWSKYSIFFSVICLSKQLFVFGLFQET